MRERVKMVIVLVSLSVVSALLLAGINALSSDVIKKSGERGLKLAVLSVLDIPLGDKAPEALFEKRVEKVDAPEGTLYLSVEGEGEGRSVDGAAFALKGPGFWGPISMILGVDIKSMTIRGIEIVEQNETPGLGARIEEAEFRGQFRGKRLDQPLRIRRAGASLGSNVWRP
jgi:Na+-transporting NADH:ubiquinone oxidoreductase subunit C